MSKEHRITTVLDMLELSEDEFFRMIPDLIAWYSLCRGPLCMPGVRHTGFRWIDDGKPGEVHSVLATIVKDGNQTGEVMTIKGSAYDGPPEAA